MRRKLSNIRAVWLVGLLFLLLILGACATGSIREKVLTMPVIEGASYVGQETCAACHEELSGSFAQTVHGRLADFELTGAHPGCESCHGAGSLHVESEDYDQILKFSELNPAETAAVCIKCHGSGDLMSWTHSEHALSDVGCTDCHEFHTEGKVVGPSLKKSDPELCYECHREQQAKASFPSHHPVKEGKMTCSDCHNPHEGLRTEERPNDLCLNCHARYQGPFVFEHAPVQEDCSICHDPHGTVANNLLKQNEPFLCLQCHENHFHAAREGAPSNFGAKAAFNGDAMAELAKSHPQAYAEIIDGKLKPSEADTFLSNNDIDKTVSIKFVNEAGLDSWRMGFNTKCTVCHSVVHGSDLPSQTAPVIDVNGKGYPKGGAGLTR